jgi:hypothetical protein
MGGARWGYPVAGIEDWGGHPRGGARTGDAGIVRMRVRPGSAYGPDPRMARIRVWITRCKNVANTVLGSAGTPNPHPFRTFPEQQ